MELAFLWKHIFYFIVGIFQDLLITYYYQVVAKEYAWRAAISSTIVTLVNLFVFYGILGNIEEEIYTIIIAYGIGCGVGTFIVIRRHELRAYFRK